MFGVAHLDAMPFIYGIVIFITIYPIWYSLMGVSFLRRIYKGMGFLHHSIPFLVFYLMLQLHGGSMTGGMASTVTSVLCMLTFPLTCYARDDGH